VAIVYFQLMYCRPYTEPNVITIDQTIKLIPIQVITLTLDEPSISAVKAAKSVPSLGPEGRISWYKLDKRTARTPIIGYHIVR
jgi:hypothetical protein